MIWLINTTFLFRQVASPTFESDLWIRILEVTPFTFPFIKHNRHISGLLSLPFLPQLSGAENTTLVQKTRDFNQGGLPFPPDQLYALPNYFFALLVFSLTTNRFWKSCLLKKINLSLTELTLISIKLRETLLIVLNLFGTFVSRLQAFVGIVYCDLEKKL